MSWLLNPDDWFGRHPGACIVMIVLLTLLVGVIEA